MREKMVDLIDRQAAVDSFDFVRRKDVIKGIQKCSIGQTDVMKYYFLLLGHMTKLPPVQPEPRWIPCTERLPEENGQYLITVKYKHINDTYEDVYAEHGEWCDGRWDMFCFGHCGEVENITAWMPLPEPYKEEDE